MAVIMMAVGGPVQAGSGSLRLEVIPPHGKIVADGKTTYRFTLIVLNEQGNPVECKEVNTEVSWGKLDPIKGATPGFLDFEYLPPEAPVPRNEYIRFRVEGQEAERPLTIVPPAGLTVSVGIAPERIFAGQPDPAVITLTVKNQVGEPVSGAEIEFFVSVGAVGEFSEEGKGKYSARYFPPKKRFPQVAVIGVRADSEGFSGTACLPISLRGRTTIPAETKANSTVILKVGGQEFGPYESGPQGKFDAPIEVPPGYRNAKAIVTDEFGNVIHKTIDLGIPDTQRIIFRADPPELPADGRSRTQVVFFAADQFGKALGENISLSVQPGKLTRPVRLAPGVYRSTYEPPVRAQPAKARIRAEVKGDSFEVGDISLTPGVRPFLLSFDVETPELVADGEDTSVLTLVYRDVYGRGVPEGNISLTASQGKVSEAEDRGDGYYTAIFTAPDQIGPSDKVVIEAVGEEEPRKEEWAEFLRAKTSVHLKAGPPEKIELNSLHRTLMADGESTAVISAIIIDKTGNPVSGERFQVDSEHGFIGEVEEEVEGKYQFAYTAPKLRQYAREKISVAHPEGLYSSSLGLDLIPRLPYYTVGLKGTYLTNFEKISTGGVRIEGGYRLPMMNRQFFAHSEFGYYSERRTYDEVNPGLGEYEVSVYMNVWTIRFIGLYKFEELGRYIPYAGAGIGVSIVEDRIRSTFQPALKEVAAAFASYTAAGIEMELWLGKAFLELGYEYSWLSDDDGVKGNIGGLMLSLGCRYLFNF